MCFGGGGGDSGAAEAKAREAKRQANITKGMEEINRIFDGYSRGKGAVAAPVDGQNYYTTDGTKASYSAGTGKPIGLTREQLLKLPRAQQAKMVLYNPNAQWSNSTSLGGMYRNKMLQDAGKYYRADQFERRPRNFSNGYNNGGNTYEKRLINQDGTPAGLTINGKFTEMSGDPLYSGVEKVAGFDEDFYKQRENAFLDYSRPALEDQYQDARKNMIFALSRSGNLSSSAAGDKQRKLGEERARHEMDLVNQGRAYSQETQGNVENARSDLISQLTATEDPAAAAKGAMQRSALLSKPPAFDPVGQFVFRAADSLNRSSGPATGYRGYAGGFAPGSKSSSSVRYS